MGGTELGGFLAEASRGGCLPYSAEREAARRFGLSPREVEAAALKAGWAPARYERNLRLFGLEGQRRLHESSVVLAGLGGLGGYLLEFLLRLGLGRIRAFDPDRFDESNLNRQLLATTANLGRPKAEAAAERAALVNPAVDFRAEALRLDAGNAREALAEASALLDGLDSARDRSLLSGLASEEGKAFIHAAVGGWYGQALRQGPGSRSLEMIYGKAGQGEPGPGIETELGNQSFLPAFAAALETAELLKLLLGLEPSLEGRLLVFDLLGLDFQVLSL